MWFPSYCTVTFFTIVTLVNCQSTLRNSPSWVLQTFFSQCSEKEELIKCLKIQALKVTERALRIKSFDVTDGLSIVGNNRLGKSVSEIQLNEAKLEKLSHDDLDGLLGDRASRFLDTHKIEVNLGKLIESDARSLAAEPRKKEHGGSKKGGGYGALLAALAIKGSFLAMAYKGIAVMSGTAILIGKMALLLSVILGLKKLVSGQHEKTTFEIIKTPKYTEDYVHSTTHEDDHHEKYRRSYLENADVHRRVYRLRIPKY